MKLYPSYSPLGTLTALAGLIFAGSSAFAASVTFSGTTANTKWNIPANWSTGSVPVAGDEVFVVQSGSKNLTIDLNSTYGAPGLLSLLVDAEGSGNIFINSAKNFTVSGTETIGDFGKGAFNQNKGIHTADAIVLAASSTGSLGTYTIKKGTLNVGSDLVVGGEGQGVFTHRGGNANIGGDFVVGSGIGSTSSYTRTKGNLTVQGNTVIGDEGLAFFTQSRGKTTLVDLGVGGSATGEGNYNLQGGTLSTVNAVIGVGGVGTFNQSGGTHNVEVDLVIGGAGLGSYNQSNGNLNVSGKLIVGIAGSGQFDQSGGKTTVSQGVVVNDGGYFLDDASLTTSSLTVNANGSFAMSGTTSRLRTSGDVTFDSSASISTSSGKLILASNSDVNLTVLGDDLGKNAAGFGGNYAWDSISLERNVTLSLDGTTGVNALYVDKLNLGSNSIFRIDSIIIGNGVNVYYNADAEENAYLVGGRYALGNGGFLIPISTEEAASALGGSGTLGASFSLGLSSSGAGLTTGGVYTGGLNTSYTLVGGDFDLAFSESFAQGTLSESSFSPGVVPEPATAGLAVMGLLALLARRRAAAR